MKLWAILTAVLLCAGCVDILNESSSNEENYEVGNDGTVKVVYGNDYTNITEAAAIEYEAAGRLIDGVLLPSDEELTREIYE